MKYALVFSSLGIVCAVYGANTDSLWLRALFFSFAICWLGVGLAYAGLGGRIFGKRRDGRLAYWSLLFWPFHLLNSALLGAFRRSKKESRFDLIEKNIILGCQLGPGDETPLATFGVRSVLDLTCEFAEARFLRRLNYLSIPLLDTHAPALKQLQEGADFLVQNAANGPIYVHCALGHGRSALFVAAYLIKSGQARTPAEAVELIRAKRPRVGLHPSQRSVLERFTNDQNAAR